MIINVNSKKCSGLGELIFTDNFLASKVSILYKNIFMFLFRRDTFNIVYKKNTNH